MTYLDWGCELLAGECRSCLDAICNACFERYRARRGTPTVAGLQEICPDTEEPDCDHCEPQTKADCRRCGIILAVCRNCCEHTTCEFRITD